MLLKTKVSDGSMEEDQYSIIDKDHSTEAGKDPVVVVDDEHHERYYTEENAVEQRAYQKRNDTSVQDSRYQEETSAEISTIPNESKMNGRSDASGKASGGTGIGAIALIISILSLFMMPFILGILGIIIGFSARKRGSSMGSWAIGISAVSIIVGIFILPFF
ncbi:DUF4190 domain-containing protein [Peribacillus sp. NPDC097206]|uniref:DUF4190 domain-containing protein n=2 Tax=Peribacillus TaxID=2675229 RepID=UPI0037FAB9C2